MWRREQLDDETPRMQRCGRCKERYYCNKECQLVSCYFCTYFSTDFDRTVLILYHAEDWSDHKGDIKNLECIKVILLPIGGNYRPFGQWRPQWRRRSSIHKVGSGMQSGPRRCRSSLRTLPETSPLSRSSIRELSEVHLTTTEDSPRALTEILI